MISRRDILKMIGVALAIPVPGNAAFLDEEAPGEDAISLTDESTVTTYRGHGSKRLLLSKIPAPSLLGRIWFNSFWKDGEAPESSLTQFQLLRVPSVLFQDGLNTLNGYLWQAGMGGQIAITDHPLTLNVQQQIATDWAVSFRTLPIK